MASGAAANLAVSPSRDLGAGALVTTMQVASPHGGWRTVCPHRDQKDSGCGHMKTTVPTGLVLHPSRDMPPRLLWSYVIVALSKAYFFFFFRQM